MKRIITFQNYAAPKDNVGAPFAHWTNLFIVAAIVVGGGVGIAVVKLNHPTYIIVGAIALAVFVASIFSIQFGLLALVFSTYTRLSDVAVHAHNIASVARPLVVLLIIAILIRWAIFRERPKGWEKAAILLGVYGLVIFMSLLYATNTTRVMQGLLSYSKDAIITLIVIILLQTADGFRRVIWLLLLTGIFLGTLSVYQAVTESYANSFGGFAVARLMNIIGESYTYRIGGPVNDPNAFAQIMLVFVPIALDRFLKDPRLTRKIVALWALVVSFLCVLFSYSRGGFVALVMTMLIFLWFHRLSKRQFPVFIISVIILMSFAPRNFYDRILTLDQYFNTPGSVRTNDASLRGRATLNLAALEMIKAHPLLGVGFNNFSIEYPRYVQLLGLFGVPLEDPEAHDLYLEVASETGLLGLIAFFSLVGTALSTVYRTRLRFLKARMNNYAEMVTAFGIGFTGYLISAMFIHGAYPRYLYLLSGIALALKLVADNTLAAQSLVRGKRS